MTDAVIQAYVPSLATMILVAIGILFNNARISDLNTNLNKRMDDLRADTFARFERLETQYAQLEKIIIGKLGEVEARLDKIESRLNLH